MANRSGMQMLQMIQIFGRELAASQDGYSFNVYCNPPSGKIGCGVFPVPPQDAFQAMRSFLELVVS